LVIFQYRPVRPSASRTASRSRDSTRDVVSNTLP
jgi:hypothetical protein